MFLFNMLFIAIICTQSSFLSTTLTLIHTSHIHKPCKTLFNAIVCYASVTRTILTITIVERYFVLFCIRIYQSGIYSPVCAIKAYRSFIYSHTLYNYVQFEFYFDCFLSFSIHSLSFVLCTTSCHKTDKRRKVFFLSFHFILH